MASAAGVIAMVAWAHIAVAALWGWGDLLAYLPWVLHRAAGAGAVLAVAVEYLARVFLTVAAGLGVLGTPSLGTTLAALRVGVDAGGRRCVDPHAHPLRVG